MLTMKRRSMICLLVLLTIGLLSVKLTPRDKLEEVCNDKIPLSICANKTQHRLEENALENEDKKHVVREAKRIAIYYGMVMVTFINKAFVPFLTNWMCHTDKMVNYSQVLVLVTDKSVYMDISAQYPSLTVVYISVFEEMNGRQKYCTAGFMRIGIYRTRVVNWLIQENIPVFLFELDALWVSNPIPFVTSKKEYDLTIIPTYEKSFEAAIGFYYMRNTTRMKRFWAELVQRLNALDTTFSCLHNEDLVRSNHNDQIQLMELILEHYRNIVIYFLPLNTFLDGKWYKNPNTEQLKNAFILNFNFIIGIQEKIKRAKRFGHWFVADDHLTCVRPSVEMTLRNQIKNNNKNSGSIK
nr:UDP-D-xylose:L-fucose alpha-1,3-D-xylosyltransferase-like isoform X1 [Crassostrea gigas]